MTEEMFKALTNLLTEDKWDVDGNGCWIWNRSTSKGYGKITARRSGVSTTMSAPRVALSKKLGRPVRKGMLACHDCDEPLCVNPDHLYEGTPEQNTADMFARGRTNDSFRKGGRATRKLTEDEVEEIRNEASKGALYPPLARQYNISVSTVSNIVTGKLYGYGGLDARGDNAGIWKSRARRKLTEEQVREIRRRYAWGEGQTLLEEEFGLGRGTVSRIVHRKLYADVEEEA